MRSRLLTASKIRDHGPKPVNDTGYPAIVELVGCVLHGVIKWIPEWRSVGDHDRLVSLSPERPVVGPPDSWHPGRHRGTLGGELHGTAERGDRAAHERPRLQVAHEPNEVADIR